MVARLPEPAVAVTARAPGYRVRMPQTPAPAPGAVDPTAHLTDPVWHHAAAGPHRVQFARPTTAGWEPVTCARFRDDVLAAARGLAAAGVGPGSRVGLVGHTRYEWTVTDYAILACGGATVPVYPTTAPEQAVWMLADAGATGAVVETDRWARDLAAAGLPTGCWIRGLDSLGRLDDATVDPDEILGRVRAAHADDLASIVYTSGTTGTPKGCPLTHRNLLADVDGAITVLSPLFRHPDAATLLSLPLAHAFARLVQFGCVQAGVTLAFGRGPRQVGADMISFRPTFLLVIPRMLEKLQEAARARATGRLARAGFAGAEATATGYSHALETPAGPGPGLRARRWLFERLVYRRLREQLGGRCRYAICGGAPLSPDLAHFLRGAGLTVLEGYGLTETSAALTVNPPQAPRIGTVGRPLPGVQLRLAADGEVLAAGEMVVAGYWGADEPLTDEAGWFHTGDLGAWDDAGYLRITGRKKDLIVTAGGKNVAPAQLEERLNAHPLIAHGIVVGDQRPFVAALIAIDEEAWPRWLSAHHRPTGTPVAALRDDPELVTEVQRAVDDANRAVSRAEAIRRFRILPTDFTIEGDELTPTLKVKRNVVAARYRAEIEQLYA